MRIKARFKGGPGSGHFDHAGRPGKVGGSAPSNKKIEVLYFDPDYNDEGYEENNRIIEAAYEVANKAGLYISSDKSLEYIAKSGDKVVGAVFTSFYIDNSTNQAEYSFDAAVLPDYQGKGVGSKLVDVGIQEFRNIQDTEFPNTVMIVNVVNPVVIGMLERRGAIIIDEYKPATYMKLKDCAVFTFKGGPGSGHHGHLGRPGKIGGSLPADGQRVWQGERQEPTRKRLSKLEVGERGEALAARVLSEIYDAEFISLNEGINNAPLDMGGDHRAVEVKTGLVTNTSTALHWRATIGQPGKAETELIRSMTREQKREHNLYKQQQIMKRKYDMLSGMSELVGAKVEPITIGIILSEDGSRGDVYEIPGFHLRLTWKDYATDEYYVGTYDYID